VFPGIAEIVFVAELRALVGCNLRQLGFHFIPIPLLAEAHVFIVKEIGIARIAGEEMMQVTVGPSHRDLQDGVEPAEAGRCPAPAAAARWTASCRAGRLSVDRSGGGLRRSQFKVGNHAMVFYWG